MADEGTTKLNYLIKALLAEFANKIKFIKEEFEKHKEAKKREIDVLLFKEKREKAKIEKYQQELSEIESKIKLLQERKDNSPSKEYFLNKLSVGNDYRNTFQKYFELNENAKYSLFGIQKKITELSKEITNLKKTKDNIKADPFLQSDLYKIQKDIINVSKELKTLEKGKNNIPNDSNYGKKLSATQKSIAKISKELKKLEKEKMNIQSIQIVQPPVTTELPKNIKIKSNVALSLVVGFFLMFFLSFLLEYIGKYKSSLKHKQPL